MDSLTSPASHKKLLLLIPNLGLGGAQRVFHDHSVEFAKHYAVTEAVFNSDGDDLYPSGNSVHSLNVPGGGGVINKLLNFSQRVRGLRHLREQLRPAVCISHLEGADYVNLLSGGTGKTVLCIHGSKLHDANINGLVGWLRKRVLMPLLYNRADKIITVSRDINPELIEGFGVKSDKVLTINNFFEIAQISAKAQESLSAAEQVIYATAPVLITAGRLTRQKNQAPMLDIMAALRKRRAVKLVFVGDGELRDDLVAHARKLGLRVYAAWENTPLVSDDDVYFMGLQQNPFKYMRPAAAFVFPSAWEGFPMALGEAMACGLPVLSADCPTGPREMLAPNTITPTIPLTTAETGEFGVLLPMLTLAGSQAAHQQVWVTALDVLLADESERQRLGLLARQRMNDFTRERIFSQWMQVIEEVCYG